MDVTGIRKALNYLNTEIDKISGESTKAISSGLRTIQSKEAIMLWVKRGESENVDHCWYILDADNKRLYQKANAVTGILAGLSTRFSSFDDEKAPSLKISFWIQSEVGLYRIESGIDTTFTKGVLMGLRQVPLDNIGKVLSIGAEPSKEKSGKGAMVVFGNVYDDLDNAIHSEWDKDITGVELLDQVALHFGVKISEKSDSKEKSGTTAETYLVKGINIDKGDALRYWYGQVKLQCTRLNWSPEEMTKYIISNKVGLPLKDLNVKQVQDLVDALKKTPVKQQYEATEHDEIPF